jgi:hypothetical protein
MRSKGRPALIELTVDPQHITPNQSLDRIRSTALGQR